MGLILQGTQVLQSKHSNVLNGVNIARDTSSPKQALKPKFSKFSKVVTVQAVTVEKSLQNGFFCAVDIDSMKSKSICSTSWLQLPSLGVGGHALQEAQDIQPNSHMHWKLPTWPLEASNGGGGLGHPAHLPYV